LVLNGDYNWSWFMGQKLSLWTTSLHSQCMHHIQRCFHINIAEDMLVVHEATNGSIGIPIISGIYIDGILANCSVVTHLHS
jgi:hypothetical protein